MGRWTGQDSATPLGGLRACVRACVKGWRRSPCRCAQTAAAAAKSGLGRQSIRPSHVWIGKGREGYAGGKEGLEGKRDDCADCSILQPGCRTRCAAAALGREARRKRASKQASKQAFATITTQACLLHQSLRSPFAPIGPRRTAN